MCVYKLGTGGDGNLMPIRMNKMFFFLQTNINELNRSINKIMLQIYVNYVNWGGFMYKIVPGALNFWYRNVCTC